MFTALAFFMCVTFARLPIFHAYHRILSREFTSPLAFMINPVIGAVTIVLLLAGESGLWPGWAGQGCTLKPSF
jgi:hypothetical protein